MVFVSLLFLFLFLPCVLVGYYLLIKRRRLQNLWLLLASLIFYAWGEPRFSLVLVFSIILNWGLAIIIDSCRSQLKVCKLVLACAVVYNLGLLYLYKYWDFSASVFNSIFQTAIPLRNTALPIGISFFTFQALSYVVDVYRGGDVQAQRNPLNVGLYISFFPQLIAGPIVRYNTIAKEIDSRRETAADFGTGCIRFMAGFAKKVLLANSMAVIADKAFSSEELAVSFAWLGAIAYTLQIYYDFSGYSDMAIGLGRMFGFHFEENFNYPYAATSVTDFWRRWHISLSSWFRDYVYIPLGGSRTTKGRTLRNLFVVWLLTGIWHGANWTFICWGLFYFAVLILEKQTPLGEMCSKHRLFGHCYTMLAVILAWVIFRADSISAAGRYLSILLGHAKLWDPLTWVYIRENIFYLIAALLLAPGLLHFQRKDASIGTNSILVLLIAAAFFTSVIYVVNGSYNPFIYFNF